MIISRLRRTGQRGSVTIELALVTALFLLPLTVGSVDMLFVLTQRFQMHRALQSLYFYAWTNPNNANNQGAVTSALNTAAANTIANVTLATAPVTTYDCASNQQSTNPSPPTTSKPSCSSSNPLQTFVTYSITATVNLPVPIPGFTSAYPLDLSGTIQIS